jgi:serine/threonine protein kinase
MSEQPERIAGRFRVVRELGQGAAATVYEVVDERLGVRRALKRLSPNMTRFARMRARLISEARAMARLTHPNVVRVFDVFIDKEDACIVMEIVQGGSLVSILEENGPFPPRRAIDLMDQVLSALQFAHESGIVHRDIKPHNILIDAQGHVRVTDFGVARFLHENDNLTRTGVTMGTWALMAPEQRADAKSVDHRADIYSAGATLYSLLTATTPKDLFAIDLDPALISDIPGPLAGIIQRSTSYHREARFRSASEMAEALRAAASALDASAALRPGATHIPQGMPRPVPAPSIIPPAEATAATITAVSSEATPFGSLHAISPVDDDRLGPPPPLPYRRSTSLAQLLGLAALVILAFSAWPVFRDLFPLIDVFGPAPDAPTQQEAVQDEPETLLAAVQVAPRQVVRRTSRSAPAATPPPIAAEQLAVDLEDAVLLTPVAPITVEELDAGPEEAREIHAPAPSVEDVLGAD